MLKNDENNENDEALATALLSVARAMVTAPQGGDPPLGRPGGRVVAQRLNVGTSGNVSARHSDGFIVTPSGLPPEHCTAADMVMMTMQGDHAGTLAPSSEWRIHRDIYASVPEAGAVLHAHSPFATAIACLRKEIPPFHYMIARFGGNSVRCAAYATFGTEALSEKALTALDGRNACLLANHGMLVYGHDLEDALARAVELETLCEQYWRACQLGTPVVLSEAEMAEAIERFHWYGRPRRTSGN